MIIWTVYAPLGQDPYQAVSERGRRLVSSDLEALRKLLRELGLRPWGPRPDDPNHVVEIWAKTRPVPEGSPRVRLEARCVYPTGEPV